ncbi:MAG: enoyl-CoA hydratase [Gammaproteobacteria bacterium]|jgi:enoyl-CoA hydratase/carnithine racemase
MELKTDKMIAEKKDGVGWMTFNNPARRNAMSLEMWEAVGEIMDDFMADPAVKCCVMRGAGDKAFVSGADISQFKEKRNDADAAAEYDRISSDARRKLGAFQKPLIAMIRGYCLGGGLGVAMNADFRIATEDSQFGIPAARLGIAYTFENVKRLIDLVGPSRGKEILITARRLPAAEAYQIGLINRVVPVEKLEEAVAEFTDAITVNAPLSMKASKLIIAEILKDKDDRDYGLIETLKTECFDSNDYQEGREAFMEKRKPVFTGT